MSDEVEKLRAELAAANERATAAEQALEAFKLGSKEGRDRLRSEFEAELNEWRDATGLCVGGDPGGVEPETLRKHVDMLDDIAREAMTLVDEHGHTGIFGNLANALAAYRRLPEV